MSRPTSPSAARSSSGPDLRWLLPVAAPILVAIFVTGLFVAAELAGLRPFQHAPLTVSEAAAEGDVPALLRLLYGGKNPRARYSVGTDIIRGPKPRNLTPLEAAAIGDQPAAIEIIERWGVPIDNAERAHLLCLAERAAARASVEVLKRDGLEPACDAAPVAGIPP